jgi:hypothetical protein
MGVIEVFILVGDIGDAHRLIRAVYPDVQPVERRRALGTHVWVGIGVFILVGYIC